jgi:hypothetical protein
MDTRRDRIPASALPEPYLYWNVRLFGPYKSRHSFQFPVRFDSGLWVAASKTQRHSSPTHKTTFRSHRLDDLTSRSLATASHWSVCILFLLLVSS